MWPDPVPDPDTASASGAGGTGRKRGAVGVTAGEAFGATGRMCVAVPAVISPAGRPVECSVKDVSKRVSDVNASPAAMATGTGFPSSTPCPLRLEGYPGDRRRPIHP
ncbi:hypothetical protein GCM10023075_03240 [Streptosporangium album]